MKAKKPKIPNAFVIVFIIMVFSAIMTYIIPAGQYDLVEGTKNIDPNTFHRVEQSGTTLWGFVDSFFTGMQNGSSIILFTILLGGYFNVMIETKAFDAFISLLIKKMGTRTMVIIPIMAILMSVLGAVGVMANPVVAVVPVGIILAKKLKLDPLMGLAVTFVAAYTGYAMSPMCPMTVQTAQKIAEVPLMSGFGFRLFGWAVIMAVTVAYMMHYGNKVKMDQSKSVLGSGFLSEDEVEAEVVEFKLSHGFILVSLAVGMGIYVYGSLKLGWGLNYMAGVMLIVAFLSACFGRMGSEGFVQAFLKGARQMTFSALLIGCATAISVILTQGRILHSIIYGMAIPLHRLPDVLAGSVMYYVNLVFNFFVSSGSGQAAVVMPIMAPLSDVVGVSRQMAICAFQYGDGLSNLIFPTNGTMMACIAVAGVRYDKWMKWMMPLFGIWFVISTILIIIGSAVGVA